MSIMDFIYMIIIKPIEILYEIIFSITYNTLIENPGIAIIVLSMVVNVLVLPLYIKADKLQKEEKDIEKKLEVGVKHIKKTFKGDEQLMMLQTYYRQNNYKPTYVLRSLTSLLLQIPFFIAAYNFLSGVSWLNGFAFGPIKDLAAPDGLLSIMGIKINVLPILMTSINLVSSFIYSKGDSLKNKLQLYLTAIFFLVFLYNCPSGLVFYWTLNNVFSLVKTLFEKVKHKKEVLCIGATLIGLVFAALCLYKFRNYAFRYKLVAIAIGLLSLIPTITLFVKVKAKLLPSISNKKIYIFSILVLIVLTGMLIPSSVIASSPQEFWIQDLMENPNMYLVYSSCLAVGFLGVWLSVYYGLADEKVKPIFEFVLFWLCIAAIMNFMIFGSNLGILEEDFTFTAVNWYSLKEDILNIGMLAGLLVLVFAIFKYLSKHIHEGLIIILISLVALTSINAYKIKKSVNEIVVSDSEISLEVSNNGDNVIIIMIDRALGFALPYIFKDYPELAEKFNGFTYYNNVISYGKNTNISTPSLFGGYEYTPEALNQRDDVSLCEKQNEALRLMPILFSQNGYHVTFAEPVFANYQWVPDTTIFDEYENITSFNTTGYVKVDDSADLNLINSNKRNTFLYSVMRIAPAVLQTLIYKDNYNSSNSLGQNITSLYTANGRPVNLESDYDVLLKLNDITNVKNDGSNNLVILTNASTHQNAMLQLPDYEIKDVVDNTGLVDYSSDIYEIDGVRLKLNSGYRVSHYQVNVASLMRIGEWLDYLRENGAYDNSRIIIVSDHGTDVNCISELIYNYEGGLLDIEAFFPLLLVKDFNAQEFNVDSTFMTLADVPTIAMEGIIDNPINPFTNNPVTNIDKYTKKQYVYLTELWNVQENDGNQFVNDGCWFSISENIWDLSNWNLAGVKTYFPDK